MPSVVRLPTPTSSAVGRQDMDGMIACWAPGNSARFIGMDELQVERDYPVWFGNLFSCFPDFRFEVVNIVAGEDEAAVHWSGDRHLQRRGHLRGLPAERGFHRHRGHRHPHHRGGMITCIIALLNGLDMARQLGAVPPRGSFADRAMAGAFNAKTAVTSDRSDGRDLPRRLEPVQRTPDFPVGKSGRPQRTGRKFSISNGVTWTR